MKSPSKKSINFFIVLLLVIILGFILNHIFQQPQDGVLVDFLDVGQGDAAIIKTPAGQSVLIDGGPSDAVVSKIDRLIPFYRRKLDAVILTHPHADHLTGLIKTVDNYNITAFYMTGVVYNTPEYRQLLEKLKINKIPIKIVVSGDKLLFDGEIRLDFIYPTESLQEKTLENVNNSSIVTRLVWGESSVLFTGDLENDKLNTLDQPGVSSDVLKVPHHCSSDGIDKKFITAVSPRYAIISVGRDNDFGHPASSCLNLLKGIQVYRTDQEGDITFMMQKDTIRPFRLK
jgi:beta-lactamase superfamily II metal-dependent hydrolase